MFLPNTPNIPQSSGEDFIQLEKVHVEAEAFAGYDNNTSATSSPPVSGKEAKEATEATYALSLTPAARIQIFLSCGRPHGAHW